MSIGLKPIALRYHSGTSLYKIYTMMKAKPILPIDALHGKLDGKSTYYFRTINGKQYAQRCPKRDKPPTDSQLSSRATFAERSRKVAQMQKDGFELTVKELWKSIM